MNKKLTSRLLALALAVVTLLVFAAPALASSKVYATTALNVRSGPGTKYSILGYLNENQVVTKLGTSGKWTKIEFGGGTAYAYSSYLKPSSSSGTGTGTGTGTGAAGSLYVTGNVNVRSGPGTGYTKLGELNKGELVQRVGETGTWSIINWGSGTAYVSSSYLAVYGSSQPQQPGSTSTLYATTGVNVRKGPSTKYAIVGELVKGEGVSVTGSSGLWTQVVYKGSTAYVYTKYLSSKGQTQTQTMLYARVATELRSGPSNSSYILGYLSAGQSVVYLGLIDSTWYKVQYGSYIAYVYGPNMQANQPVTTPTSGTVYATSSAPVYISANTSSQMLGYLYAGESAPLISSLSSSWTIINYRGTPGYVSSSRITLTPGAGANNMTSYNRYLYSRADYVYCYSAPIEQNSYRLGYLDRGEAVWAMAGNGTWVQVLINNTVMFVPAVNLYDYGYSNSTDYSTGTTVYVNEYGGSPAYADLSKSPYKVPGEIEGFGKIPFGTKLIVGQQHGSLLYVFWVDNRSGKPAATLNAYVDMAAVKR